MTATSSENRTLEFLNLVKSLPQESSLGNKGGGVRFPPPRPVHHSTGSSSAAIGKTSSSAVGAATTELRTFHQQASEISQDIANTSTLLSELTYALRHKSLLENDEESMMIDQMVIRIKQSIENLNVRLETASHTIQQQKRKLGKDSQIGQEATNLVLGLQSEFAETAADFKKVLQQRTDTLKETEDMQRQIYSSNAIHNDHDDGNMMDDIPDMTRHIMMSEPPPVFGAGGNGMFPTLDLTSGLMATGEPTGSGLPRPHGIGGVLDGGGAGSLYAQHSTYSSQYSPYGAGNTSLLTPLDIQRMEQEQGNQQMLQLIPEQSYLQSRADAMSTVESNIVELGTIFQKLAGLVHEHREMVQRVEDNVEDANANIFQSMNVLTDTLNNLRSNRALAMRLFSILVVFIIFFIVFFA
jgi:syntaxin 5